MWGLPEIKKKQLFLEIKIKTKILLKKLGK